MSLSTWYVNTEGTMRVHPFELLVDEERKLSIDWNAYAGSNSTTTQNATFEVEDDGVATISGATLSGGVSTIEVGGNAEGSTTVKVSLEMSNGEVLVRKFLVKVTDPSAASDSAYQ